MVADLFWFGVGRRWGRVLRAAAVSRARELFLAHRLRALVIGKFVFEVNAAVAALAGSSGIRAGEFLICGLASALVWAGTWTGIGCVLKDGVKDVAAAPPPLGVWLIVEIAVVLAGYGAMRYVEQRGIHARGTSPPACDRRSRSSSKVNSRLGRIRGTHDAASSACPSGTSCFICDRLS